MAATPHFVHLSTSSTRLSSIAEGIVRQRIENDVQWKEVGGGKVSRETMAIFIQVRFASVCASTYSLGFRPACDSRSTDRHDLECLTAELERGSWGGWRDLCGIYEKSA